MLFGIVIGPILGKQISFPIILSQAEDSDTKFESA